MKNRNCWKFEENISLEITSKVIYRRVMKLKFIMNSLYNMQITFLFTLFFTLCSRNIIDGFFSGFC